MPLNKFLPLYWAGPGRIRKSRNVSRRSPGRRVTAQSIRRLFARGLDDVKGPAFLQRSGKSGTSAVARATRHLVSTETRGKWIPTQEVANNRGGINCSANLETQSPQQGTRGKDRTPWGLCSPKMDSAKFRYCCKWPQQAKQSTFSSVGGSQSFFGGIPET